MSFYFAVLRMHTLFIKENEDHQVHLFWTVRLTIMVGNFFSFGFTFDVKIYALSFYEEISKILSIFQDNDSLHSECF